MLRSFMRKRRQRISLVGPSPAVVPGSSSEVPSTEAMADSTHQNSPKFQRKQSHYHKASVRSVRSNRSTIRLRGLMDSVKDELTCSVCLDEYVQPRLLHCGHSFCTECLKAVALTPTIRCPQCRVVTKCSALPMNLAKPDINSLAINFAIIKILDVMHGAKKRATTNCLPCQDHPDEECKFHCGTCDRLLCSECIVNPDHGHLGHELMSMKQAANNLHRSLTRQAAEAQQVLVALASVQDKSKESLKTITENHEQVETEIKQIFQTLKSALDQRCVDLVDEVRIWKTAQLERVEDHRAFIQETHKQLVELCQEMVHLITTPPITVRRNNESKDLHAQVAEPTPSINTNIDHKRLWKEVPPLMHQYQGIVAQLQKLKLAAPSETAESEVTGTVNLEVSLHEVLKQPVHDYLDFQVLNNELPIKDYDTFVALMRKLGTVFRYKDLPPTAIKLHIHGQDNRNFTISLGKWEMTLQHLMQKIEYRIGVPVSMQRLYYQGKVMSATDDGEPVSLSQFGIENDGIVQLNVPKMKDEPDVVNEEPAGPSS